MTLAFKLCNNVDKRGRGYTGGGMMGIYITKMVMRHIKRSFLIIGLLVPIGIHAERIDLNFDALFPVTWYQKGLASTINVWHMIAQVLEAKNVQLPLDLILGKLTFGQFCIEHMHKEEKTDADDSAYFVMIVSKIRSLLAMIVVTPVMRDRADCLIEMLSKIQKTLDPLHIPADI